MVLARCSSETVQDENALTLRSCGKAEDTHHSGDSKAAKDLGGQKISTTGRGIGPDDSANDAKINNLGNTVLLTVLRQKDNADEERGSSSTSTAVASSTPLAQEHGVEAVHSSKQLDAALAHRDPPQGTDDRCGVHKRFRSEESHQSIGQNSGIAASMTEEFSSNAQTGLQTSPDDTSDDDGAPETISTSVKQKLPFTPASTRPRSKKAKPSGFKPVDGDQEDHASASTPQAKDIAENEIKLLNPVGKAIAISKRQRSTAVAPPSKRIRDVTRNGVTYRTLSDGSAGGQTSPWLPAKASSESKKRREGLLVRRRVQEVSIGRRPKFIVRR